MRDLMNLGLWNDDLKQKIVALNGSVQSISEIPEDVKARYKTAWELKQKTLIDMAAARGAFICQSQSLNLFVADSTYSKLTGMHFYSWKKGLKTGCYYLRTKAPVTAQKFTVDPRLLAAIHQNKQVADADDETASYHSSSDSESESEEELSPEEKKRRERRALLEKLSADYEKAREEAAESGCTMCSS
jgi:ribonucleoside-diphosphate reductase alpha chain